MVTQAEYLSLRQAAVELGIETRRLTRLAGYLHLDAWEPVIPRQVIERARTYEAVENRYAAIRSYLLASVHHPESN